MTVKQQQLGDFELLEQIDPGGYTTVYRAVQHMGQGVSRPAAVKVLQSFNLDDETQMATLRREVELLVELSTCPNIVTIYGFGLDEEAGPWIAMELGGRSLKHFISDDPAEPEQVRMLLRDTLRALAVVHAADPPILHRDLKPNNILSTDFGTWTVDAATGSPEPYAGLSREWDSVVKLECNPDAMAALATATPIPTPTPAISEPSEAITSLWAYLVKCASDLTTGDLEATWTPAKSEWIVITKPGAQADYGVWTVRRDGSISPGNREATRRDLQARAGTC